MWWLTVGWERPDGSTRSHAQTSSFDGRDERQQPQPDRVGEGGERLGEELGLVFVEAVLTDRRAAGDGIERCGAAGYHGETISKIFEEIH